MGNGAKILKNYEHSNYEVRMCTKLVEKRARESERHFLRREREREEKRIRAYEDDSIRETRTIHSRRTRESFCHTRASFYFYYNFFYFLFIYFINYSAIRLRSLR
jgi:hypothetical protein